MSPGTPSFTGVIPPVVTPLTTEGAVDTGSLERLVAHLLDAGVHGLFALGSSGETAYLTPAQQALVLDTVLGTCAGGGPWMRLRGWDGGEDRPSRGVTPV